MPDSLVNYEPKSPAHLKLKLVLVAIYILLLAAVIGGLFLTRSWSRQTFGNQAAQQEWETWVEAVEAQETSDSSVRRRPPKSPVPPALVLLNDFFAQCLGISLVLTTVLYASLAYFLYGVIANPGSNT
ncbi:MAG: hypothetical protein R3C28_20075 [Pirellulaceae bacterium]